MPSLLRDTAFIASIGFGGGNLLTDSILSACRTIVTSTATTPKAGGTLVVNGVSLGSYDYCVKDGNQTISAFSSADWFTNSLDAWAAFIAVKGNLTINAGQIILPSVRKLFTVIYTSGNLVIGGGISMTARGSNHRGDGISGGAVTAGNIRIATGTFGGVVNPQIPAAGGAGGAAVRRTLAGNSSGNAGTAGSSGGTGGGGSGAVRISSNGDIYSGAGAAGTSFTGGTSGSSAYGVSGGHGGPGETSGGRGGNDSGSARSNPGTGNPGGTESEGTDKQAGTGGILVIICAGVLSGAGTIVAGGVRGAQAQSDGNWTGAGGSGGGSATVLFGSDTSTITITAPGGVGGNSGGVAGVVVGGAGGAGTARKLSL